MPFYSITPTQFRNLSHDLHFGGGVLIDLAVSETSDISQMRLYGDLKFFALCWMVQRSSILEKILGLILGWLP
jgi:hypothetical protein